MSPHPPSDLDQSSGGCATMAIPAALVIRKLSYKWGILIGLALYAAGTTIIT